jgi:NTP pyrophosphatase (non-canonical NTP hydrolase)
VTASSPSKDSAVLIDVAALAGKLRQFAADRAWEQFHSPKNLVMALTGEVGELNEIFQWMTEADSQSAGTAPATSEAVSAELADVMLYLVRLADVLKVDLNEAVRHKLILNAQKYPVDKAHGSSKKYSDL